MARKVLKIVENLLILRGRDVYKVSSLYGREFTAQLVLENGKAPKRTRVHRFHADDLTSFRPCGRKAECLYERVYGLKST